MKIENKIPTFTPHILSYEKYVLVEPVLSSSNPMHTSNRKLLRLRLTIVEELDSEPSSAFFLRL